MGSGTAGSARTPTARRAVAAAIVATMLVVPPAAAAAAGTGACAPESGDTTARVAAVDETLDLRLDDGRLLRLAGVDVPAGQIAEARRALATWAEAGPVTVHAVAAAPDRWGRLPALLVRPGAGEPTAAALLLATGLARVRPEAGVHPCVAAWLEAEDGARAAKRGLWADPQAGVLAADDAAGLARQSGGFAIVEGRLAIHKARGGALYLTLGRDRWGFAAVVSRRDAARLAKAGLDVADYVGTPVRLRGDLDDRFGARIRLEDPDQLESLEPGALDAPPAGVADRSPRGDAPDGVARPH